MNAAYDMNKEKELFDLVDKIGECLTGDFHIISSSDSEWEDDSKSFRIYHKSGICVDISREEICNENTGEFESFEYDFNEEWDGFKRIGISLLIKLLSDHFIKETHDS